MITIRDPDGVYKYDGDSWKAEENPDFSEGVHVIYFDNRKCMACRIYDFEWFPLVEEMKKKANGITFWVVLCDWFGSECDSKVASKLFKEYNITASPTTLIIVNGKVKNKLEGVVLANKLRKYIQDAFK